MKNVWMATAALASLVLAACGGGGGNAALSKTFNYGAPQAPTAAEQSAATSAQSTVSGTSTFGSSPDATTASSIVSMADDLAASAIGSTPVAWGQDPNLTHAIRKAATLDTCTTVASSQTSASVTFQNCTDTESGFTFTLNGNITATSGTLNWNVTGSFSGVEQGVSINVNLHQSGTLTVTSTTVKGSATSSINGSVSGNGQSVSFGLDTAVAVDLTYTASCITSGTVEVKRVWTNKPAGASGPEFADVGVKITWSGTTCGTVQVQHSQ